MSHSLKHSKLAAIKRMTANHELREVYEKYPLARVLIESAVLVEVYEGYNRISLHYAYKDWMWAAIGNENKAYWACINVIDDLLPQDTADLHAEGSCIYDPDPPLPHLPHRPLEKTHSLTEKGTFQLLSLTDVKSLKGESEHRHAEMREVLEDLKRDKVCMPEIYSLSDLQSIDYHQLAHLEYERICNEFPLDQSSVYSARHQGNHLSDYETLSSAEKTALHYWIEHAITSGNRFGGMTSYGLKHEFEREGFYVTNGQFKGAMVLRGHSPKDASELNWEFRIRRRFKCIGTYSEDYGVQHRYTLGGFDKVYALLLLKAEAIYIPTEKQE